MSCSKIFSGDLPELTEEVIKYFQNDFSTLHSCILINRLWCRLAIPLLWENPFSIHTGNNNFIEIYLHNLNDGDLKTKLQISGYLLPSNTLFNYPSFLKYLNIYEFLLSIHKWRVPNRNIIHDLNPTTDFLKLVYIPLFKIFIENEVNLHTLEIRITYFNNIYFENILELILQNANFIHNIRNLNLYNSDSKNTMIKNRISQIINLQRNLKKILIDSNTFPLYQSLLLSKDYNCSNTLNTIIFYRVDFKYMNHFDKAFERLNVLESVHIIFCSFPNSFTQQIINLIKPFKLKSLFMAELQIDNELLQLLLQKSDGYLENFSYETYSFVSNNQLILSSRQQLLELILKYIKNIKYLDFNGLYNQSIIYSVFNLIENTKQNLNYLIITVNDDYQLPHNIERSTIILRNLGQILPPKLEYLKLFLCIKTSDLKIFLKNSQNTLIKKLVIDYIIQEDSDDIDILPYIKEYIMKDTGRILINRISICYTPD